MEGNGPSTTERQAEGEAAAIECADEYVNVALAEDGHRIHMEVSDIFLPDLLRGIDISHVQLMPTGPPHARRLEFVFTQEQRHALVGIARDYNEGIAIEVAPDDIEDVGLWMCDQGLRGKRVRLTVEALEEGDIDVE